MNRHPSATIRLATVQDAGDILKIYAPFCRDTFITFETEPPTLEEMRARIERKVSSYPWLVCQGPTMLSFAHTTSASRAGGISVGGRRFDLCG